MSVWTSKLYSSVCQFKILFLNRLGALNGNRFLPCYLFLRHSSIRRFEPSLRRGAEVVPQPCLDTKKHGRCKHFWISNSYVRVHKENASKICSRKTREHGEEQVGSGAPPPDQMGGGSQAFARLGTNRKHQARSRAAVVDQEPSRPLWLLQDPANTLWDIQLPNYLYYALTPGYGIRIMRSQYFSLIGLYPHSQKCFLMPKKIPDIVTK